MSTESSVPAKCDSTASAVDLPGFEPDNLLAFLAMLGLLRSVDIARPAWRARVAWHGVPMIARLYLDATSSTDEIVAAAEDGIRELARTYEFDRADITYEGDEFRGLADAARFDRERARLVAALASDGARRRDGEAVEPTALCAMFGQGHQHFLTRLMMAASRPNRGNLGEISRALFEPWRYEDETDSFRWDPIEDRRYAQQFGDPSEGRNKIGTVTGANRLAAIGFGTLTSVPTAAGLATLGVYGPRWERNVCWPLAAVPTSLAGHLALLAHPWLGDAEEAGKLASYGVGAVARARRFQVGKFFNFERANVRQLGNA